jgi:hypothetical protein
MAVRPETIEYIQLVRFILGDASTGIEDESIEVMLDRNKRYFYRLPCIPQNTRQLYEAQSSQVPSWYEYREHTVWKAPYVMWEPTTSTFIDLEGDAITPASFDIKTGFITLSEAKADLRITGYVFAIYTASLHIVLRAMGDKTSYYQYSNDGGEQNEAQWFLNLQRLSTELRRAQEVY